MIMIVVSLLAGVGGAVLGYGFSRRRPRVQGAVERSDEATEISGGTLVLRSTPAMKAIGAVAVAWIAWVSGAVLQHSEALARATTKVETLSAANIELASGIKELTVAMRRQEQTTSRLIGVLQGMEPR